MGRAAMVVKGWLRGDKKMAKCMIVCYGLSPLTPSARSCCCPKATFLLSEACPRSSSVPRDSHMRYLLIVLRLALSGWAAKELT